MDFDFILKVFLVFYISNWLCKKLSEVVFYRFIEHIVWFYRIISVHDICDRSVGRIVEFFENMYFQEKN